MRTLQVKEHLSNQALQAQLAASRATAVYTRWQIIYLVQVGKVQRADLIAPLVNLSVHSIYKIVESYNQAGASAMVYKPKGGRRRSLLSLAQEAALISTLQGAAAKGLIKTANDIRHIVEQKVKQEVSDDYLWDLLHRHGWKKKMPRPHHPKRSLAEQADFKKNSPKSWMPQH